LSRRLLVLLTLCMALALMISAPVNAWILDWAHAWGGHGTGYQEGRGGVVVDSSGNVYFAGRNEDDRFVSKFDPDGDHLWSLDLDASGMAMFEDMAMMPDGNLCAVGWSQEFTTSTFAAIDIFSQDGTLLLDKLFGDVWGEEDYYANAVAVDKDGNIYVVGDIYSEANNDYDAFAAKFNSSGSLKWLVRWSPGADDVRERAYDVAFYDGVKDDYLYIAGEHGATGFVMKFNLTSLAPVWFSINIPAHSVAVDFYGAPWVSGWSYDQGTLICLDPSTGNPTYSIAITHDGYAKTIYYDIYIAGLFKYLVGEVEDTTRDALLTAIPPIAGLWTPWSLVWAETIRMSDNLLSLENIHTYISSEPHIQPSAQ